VSLGAVRQFHTDVAMVKVFDWQCSSKGRSLGSYRVAESVPMFSRRCGDSRLRLWISSVQSSSKIWAASALLRAVRRFHTDVAMAEVVDWRRSSRGRGPGGIVLLRVFRCFHADVAIAG